MSACVRFSNDTALGLNGFILNPFNGNQILVYNPITLTDQLMTIPNSGISGLVSNCYIDNIPNKSMPYNIIHVAFLKMDASQNLFINWLPWSLAGTKLSSSGYTTDIRTGTGHIIGMAIRLPTYEIQGQANSQLLISYYNRGQCSFMSTPAGTAPSGAGWVPIGSPTQLLIWQDDFPLTIAALNMTGSIAGASMQASIGLINSSGQVLARTYGAATNEIAGNPYIATLIFPGTPIAPGFYTYQIYLTANEGTVTLGAALNSTLITHGKF